MVRNRRWPAVFLAVAGGLLVLLTVLVAVRPAGGDGARPPVTRPVAAHADAVARAPLPPGQEVNRPPRASVSTGELPLTVAVAAGLTLLGGALTVVTTRRHWRRRG